MPCRDWKRLSYRSAIFYTSPEQKRTAAATIADVEASGLWPGKIVTEVSFRGAFWEAEPEASGLSATHSRWQYLQLHPPKLETAL
jgi:peptide methionine sulfoxide reductase MsrA